MTAFERRTAIHNRLSGAGHRSLKRTSTTERVTVTSPARQAIAQRCQSLGPQVLLLTWPRAVTTMPASVMVANPYDVIVGHVEGCPVYVDVRTLWRSDVTSVMVDVLAAQDSADPILTIRPRRD
jgi:hypothetical protein